MTALLQLQLRVVRRWRSAVVLAAVAISVPCAFAQTESKDRTDIAGPSPSASPANASTPAAGQPNDAEMMKQMIELSKLNENHKLLAKMAGSWSFNVTMWMSPDAPPMKSSGTAIRKPIMDGRYFTFDTSGTMKMPGPDGKLQEMQFKGTSLEGYDNVKQKFFATWADNMGTSLMVSEGIYDPPSKTFTFRSQYEPAPGVTIKVREALKLVDDDHQMLEWFEDRGGQEVKTMEINYTRKK